jgi:uncharacterized protein (TIGR00369 family)
MNTKNTLQPNTHLEASEKFVGKIISLENGISKVTLIITSEMVVDKFGLAHGSFAFGLADYAAMLAINEPTVVLGKAEVKFIKPVILNEEVTANAKITDNVGKKIVVNVIVSNQKNELVFEGDFTCFVLDKHILSK